MLLLCCSVVSNSDVCPCMHLSCAFVQAELSPGLQALPKGRKSSWMNGVTSKARNHSPGSETEKETQTEVSELKEVSGSQRNIQTKTPEKNELLPDQWSSRLVDCDWVTETLCRRWRCGHCTTPRQLARWNRICFSDPIGTHWKTHCHPYISTPLRVSSKRELGTGFRFGRLCFCHMSANWISGRVVLRGSSR